MRFGRLSSISYKNDADISMKLQERVPNKKKKPEPRVRGVEYSVLGVDLQILLVCISPG
jgi:hypothetical protein